MEQALRVLPDQLRRIVVPGMVTLQGLKTLLRHTLRHTVSHTVRHTSQDAAIEVIIDDPFKLLLAGEPARTAAVLDSMLPRWVMITYRHAPRLVAITVNPSYPAFDGTVYHPALLDPPVMLQRFRERLSTPVADVFAPDGESGFCRSVFDSPSAP